MTSRSYTRSKTSSSRTLLPTAVKDGLHRLLFRALGLSVIGLGLALLLALVTYNAADPSWNSSGKTGDVHNWLGSMGSYTADVGWQFFGYAAVLFPLIILAWGWRLFQGTPLDRLHWRLLATLGAIITLACLLAMIQLSSLSGGAFGALAIRTLPQFLLADWGLYPSLFLLAVCSGGLIYLACALSVSEWHELLVLLQQAARFALDKALTLAEALGKLIRNDRSLTHELDDDDLEADEEPVEQEDKPKKSKRLSKPITETKPEIKKPKNSGLVQRPTVTTRQGKLALRQDSDHALPPLELLQWPDQGKQRPQDISEEALEKNAKLLESVLADFGVHGQIINVSPGPVVTLYDLEPAPGTRAARVVALADDIARNMSVASVRIASVPGKNVIGIELPNARRETVYLRELLTSEQYTDNGGNLPLVLGKNIAGEPIIADLSRMPHLLIAGTTGSGKSVAINTMILSLLYRLPPQKCRFIMIDPKMLELSVYEGIPHLLAPVVTEPKKAIMALKWTVREMEERYRAMSKLGVRNIEGYNLRLREAAKNGEKLMRTVQTGFDRETGKPMYEEQPLDLTELPFIVVIVDEMADLMIVAGKEIEGAVQRLAQMARAAGIHIMMATQRPSVDVITGTIKANFPTRISFQVTSKIDSRTILGEQGAEQLLGQGDMLFMAGGGRITRVHGPFVKDQEVEQIVKFLKAQGEPEYLEEVTAEDESGSLGSDDTGGGGLGGEGGSGNDLYDKAVDIVLRERKASISYVQRCLQIGYNRAATLIERMERDGIISPANHVGKREIYGRKPDDE
jgi:S-DNA-T family DNA segregation ATPase FtsK/SpoIIIE